MAFTKYPKRAILGLALFIGQPFLYNGVTFNIGTLLNTFYGVSASMVPLFIIIWALGNFAGPLILGRLFDTVGRKPMISGTYLGSAAVAVVLAIVMIGGAGNEWLFLAILVVCFFLASSGASAAYLTVSEIFPMETRALAIAFFYAVGTAVGGITGPLLFGRLIGSGEVGAVAIAFFIGAAVMAIGGVVELLFGVKAEQAKLEDLAQPLTADEEDTDDSADAVDTDSNDAVDADSTDETHRDDAQRGADDEAARLQSERLAASRERITARERQGQTAASGRGRLRPGPGSAIYSPWMRTSPAMEQSKTLDHEIEILAQATRERGVLSIRELSVAVAAKYWGPGRFRGALRQALTEGRIVQTGRGMVGPPAGDDSGSST